MLDQEVEQHFSLGVVSAGKVRQAAPPWNAHGFVSAAIVVAFIAGAQAASAVAAPENRIRVAAIDKIPEPAIALPIRNPASSRKSVRGRLQIVISVPDQRIDVFDGTVRVASSRVSTGKRGFDTPQGVFSIIGKNRYHYSNLYGGAPMPYMQRLTWSGIALHGGQVPSYPASHGCIRLPHGFAKKLFAITARNAHIIVNGGRQIPVVLEHAKLFQPRARTNVSEARIIAGLRLDDLPATELDRLDRSVLSARKADRFVQALRRAYHPNPGSHPRATIRLIQRLLGFLGYRIARPDGDFGRQTRRFIAAFQKSRAMTVTGRPSDRLTRRLYREVGQKMVGMDVAKADALLTPPAIDQPLRILITRALAYNETKRAQEMLGQLGYDVRGIDGTMGRYTRSAIKQFRIKAGLPGPARVDGSLLRALTQASGGVDVSALNGRLFVRQGYRDIFSAPITIKDIDRPLGTHVFTAMDVAPDRKTKVTWTALTVSEKKRAFVRLTSSENQLPLAASDARSALDRIELPAAVRRNIEETITPGSSLIVSDHGNSQETGEGTDFIVLTK